MRKPFEIGDKVISISENKYVFTVIGKTLSGQPLIQLNKDTLVARMHDPSLWEHYVEPKVGYVNIYSNGKVFLHETRGAADLDSGNVLYSDRVACVKITYKEGQFDD